jgi:hypothetical protein
MASDRAVERALAGVTFGSSYPTLLRRLKFRCARAKVVYERLSGDGYSNDERRSWIYHVAFAKLDDLCFACTCLERTSVCLAYPKDLGMVGRDAWIF